MAYRFRPLKETDMAEKSDQSFFGDLGKFANKFVDSVSKLGNTAARYKHGWGDTGKEKPAERVIEPAGAEASGGQVATAADEFKKYIPFIVTGFGLVLLLAIKGR